MQYNAMGAYVRENVERWVMSASSTGLSLKYGYMGFFNESLVKNESNFIGLPKESILIGGDKTTFRVLTGSNI